jgi:hypothetical protein
MRRGWRLGAQRRFRLFGFGKRRTVVAVRAVDCGETRGLPRSTGVFGWGQGNWRAEDSSTGAVDNARFPPRCPRLRVGRPRVRRRSSTCAPRVRTQPSTELSPSVGGGLPVAHPARPVGGSGAGSVGRMAARGVADRGSVTTARVCLRVSSVPRALLDPGGQLLDLFERLAPLGDLVADLLVGVHDRRVVAAAEGLPDPG